MTAFFLIIKNIAGWLYAHKTIAILSAIGVILVLVLLFNWLFGGKSKPQLDEKLNQEVHEAIESKERKKMEEVFVKVEVEQQEIDANVANSKAEVINATQEAKKKVKEMTDEELAAFLESLK